jgi:peroxiredoxin
MLHAAQLGRMQDELNGRDTDVLIIGGGGRRRAALAARLLRSPYPILADPDRAVYRAYGFERIAYLIQRSGTVLIDRGGTVRYVRDSANPQGALDRDELLDRIRRMNGS